MIEVGKEMHWHTSLEKYTGTPSIRRVRVIKFSQRATVQVLDENGNITRTTVVRLEHLQEIPERS